MDYKSFRCHLGRAGLTNKGFAELVGLNSNSITNYAKNDEVPVHWAIVAVLMGELVGNGLEFGSLLQRLQIEPNKTRGANKGSWGGSRQKGFLWEGNSNG